MVGLIFIGLFKLAIWSSGHQAPIWKEPELTKDNKKQEPVKGDTTLLGVYGKKKIVIPNNMKHLFICGTTGSGKTVTLSNFIDSIFKYDYPALIVDGKGDTGLGSILDYITRYKRQYPHKLVYVINLNSPETSDSYNPFHNKQVTVIKDMLISMTDWSEEHYKVNASRYIQKVIYLMQANGIALTFSNIIEHLDKSAFTRLSLALQKQKKITKQIHLDNVNMAESVAKIVEGTVARFALLAESDIGMLFTDDGIDIPTALNEKAIILFVLNPLVYPEMSPLFGRLITIDAKQGVSSLFHKRFSRTFYLFDEVSIYMSRDLLLLVNLSRSANITSILATQSLSDLDSVDESLRKQIIESCNNYIVMRQNEPSNAEVWATTLGTRNTIDMTYQVKKSRDTRDNTGLGTAKIVKEFLYHPDIIKNLKTGEAIYMSKDLNIHYQIKVHKPNI
ncbi:type IV secretory system conjugative DNA transfer family protein [Thomasclavelia cocleata]|uniref:type IV secretory system conjugative DNA transfer family protein n=1 Tax=Thomasclavelia cocleata TaxID=69824 RepID=UPI002570FA84|nr:type IV secretion system DNA-binding domain-containing protein [Thomasclavelia cocleata]